MKVVTIIVPVYNSEKYIRRCIDSILNQSYKDIEILLINDGSTDNSLKILNKYKNKYSNIRVIDKKNEGVAKTRNLGIKEAKGKYIMFIDNDDFIDEDYVKTFVKEIENDSNCFEVIGGYKRVDEDNNIIMTSKVNMNDWYRYQFITPWARIYDKKFLLENDIKFLSYGIGEDFYFNMIFNEKTKKIKIIDYNGYNWFYNKESISNTDHIGFNKDIDVLYLINKLDEKIDNSYHYNYCKIRFIVWYLLYSGKNVNKESFKNEFNRLFNYLKKINYKKYVSIFKPKGEKLGTRLIIYIFHLIDKFHLVKLFSKIYCRGVK